MKEETLKIILGAVIILFALIGYFGIFWLMNITNITITHQIKMDSNTRDYLIEHDYCVQMQQPPLDSNKSTKMFIGDCEYLNYDLFQE